MNNPKDENLVEIEFIGGDWLTLYPMDFSGSFSKSKNGQFIIAWSDGYFENVDADENIDTEGVEEFIIFVEKVIDEGGTPEWKDKFIKAVEKVIYEVNDANWMDEFFRLIDNEIDEGSKNEWKNKFSNALIKSVDEATEAAIERIDKMSEAELIAEIEAGIIVEDNEPEDDNEIELKTWKKGEYVLLEEKKVMVQGEMARPYNGRVANNGTFIIDEARFEDDQMTFFAFSKSGQQIFKRSFPANFFSDLSDDGHYAICQLSYSDTPDSNTIALIDLHTGKLLWQKVPETGNANSFKFDIENNAIYLCYDIRGKFKYSIYGEFLDIEKWYQACKKYGSGFELIKLAEEKMNEPEFSLTEDSAKEILELYSLAAKRLKDSSYFCAQAYRKIGEIYESLGEIRNAIINYELALKNNPKVGVKKKLKKLKPDSDLVKPPKKSPPYSLEIFTPETIRYISEEKSVQAGQAPRGVYAHSEHYDDACLYIKNHYEDSDLKEGKSSISITTQYGEFKKKLLLEHLIYRVKRASNSGNFVAISYNLKLYKYSPDFHRDVVIDISEKTDDRYQIRCVDITTDGERVYFSKGGSVFSLNRDLEIVYEWSSPSQQYYEANVTATDVAKNSNDLYIGCYSGKIYLLRNDNTFESIYDCKAPIRAMRSVGQYQYLVSDNFFDVIHHGKLVERVESADGFGNLYFGSDLLMENSKRWVRLYTTTGKMIAHIDFRDNIADSFIWDKSLKVVTPRKTYLFSVESPE